MVTTIGLHPDFNVVLRSLISLDFDAVEAYQAAIDRMKSTEYKTKLAEFREDHLRHIRELSTLARELAVEPPEGPDTKQLIAKGKVIVADMFGDRAILMAMKTNEEDTNTAYERAFNHRGMPVRARSVVERGLSDERRHRAWIIETLMKNQKGKAA